MSKVSYVYFQMKKLFSLNINVAFDPLKHFACIIVNRLFICVIFDHRALSTYLAVRIQRMADVAGFVYHRMEWPGFGFFVLVTILINIPKVA